MKIQIHIKESPEMFLTTSVGEDLSPLLSIEAEAASVGGDEKIIIVACVGVTEPERRRMAVVRNALALMDEMPADMTVGELKLELATKLVEKFQRGVNEDVDVCLNDALPLLEEAGVYYSDSLV